MRSVLPQLSDKAQDCLCVFLVCFASSCGDAVQDNDIKEYKHQLKAERRARKAAESWLRSELKSRVYI